MSEVDSIAVSNALFPPAKCTCSRGEVKCIAPEVSAAKLKLPKVVDKVKDQKRHNVPHHGTKRNKSCEEPEYYNVTSPQGICLIISIRKYTCPTGCVLKSQPGSSDNNKSIAALFQSLKFKILTLRNPKCHEIFDKISELASSKTPYEYGCFVCVILACGSLGQFYANDGLELDVREIMMRLQSKSCLYMRRKPKILIPILESGQSFLSSSTSFEDDGEKKQFDNEDFLLCCYDFNSAVESSRLLVTSLCHQIKDCYSTHDIHAILDRFNLNLMPKPFTDKIVFSSLTKKCFLDPDKTQENFSSRDLPDQWTDDQLVSECNLCKDFSRPYGPFRETLLILAVKRNHLHCVRHLLSNKAPLSDRDCEGRTALSWACHYGYKEVLICIREFSPSCQDVNHVDHAGMTPLILAAMDGQETVIDDLHMMKADLDSRDFVGHTALIHAAREGHFRVVEKLISLSADPRIADAEGNSALIWAARRGHTEVIRALSRVLDKLGDWLVKGEYNRTAVQWANYCGHSSTAEFIRECIRRLPGNHSTDVNQSSPPSPPSPSGGGSVGSGNNGDNGGDSASGGGEPDDRDHGDSRGEPPPGPRYSLNPSGGLALIVNIVTFTHQEFETRDGALVDSADKNLLRAFNKLGFAKVAVLINLDQSGLYNLATKFSDLEYSRCSAFLLCLMSHGEMDKLVSHDSAYVQLEDIFSQFRGHHGLSNKPKIFVTYACRVSSEACTVEPTKPLKSNQRGDCLYIFSVTMGGLSQRDRNLGTFHAQALRDVIHECGSQLDRTEFTLLLPRIARKVTEKTGNEQTPCYRSTLKMELFFPS